MSIASLNFLAELVIVDSEERLHFAWQVADGKWVPLVEKSGQAHTRSGECDVVSLGL